MAIVASNKRLSSRAQKALSATKRKKTPEPRDRRSGRLLAVTATGPIYRTEVSVDVVPLASALAYVQELARRADNPRAEVVSTLAQEVKGDAALQRWAATCGMITISVIRGTARQRLRFLAEVLRYARAAKRADGLEPVLASAINAAWPWLSANALERTFNRAAALIKTEFASRHSIPIFDPSTATVHVFKPGELARVDLQAWLDWREMTAPAGGDPYATAQRRGFGKDWTSREAIYGPEGLQPPGTPGHHGLDLSGMPDASGNLGGEYDKYGGYRHLFDQLGFGPKGQSIGGHKGPDMDQLPGADGGQKAEDPYGGFGSILGPGGKFAGYGAPKRPSLEGLPDAAGTPQYTDDYRPLYGPNGLLGASKPGAFGFDLSNIKGNGGPYGFGASLSPGGAETPEDVKLEIARDNKAIGLVYMAIGGAFVIGGAGGPGLVMFAAGGALYISGDIKAREILEKKPPEGKPDPVKGDKHLYPDPDGGGSGGNPTMLPDEASDGGSGNPLWLWDDNGGGGNPTTLWDENGGGGNPTTLWDDEDGGGNPVMLAEQVTGVTLTGRGLLARVEQIGPRTFAL